MLGVGKAAPAQFILRGKTNLRRISAAGQKAGFTAYPSHWASIWGTLGTSEQASYRLLRLFSKVRVRSFRCSSFSSRKRSAGLRLEDLERRIFCQYIKKAGNLFRGSLQCVYLLYARSTNFFEKSVAFQENLC